MQKSKPIKLSPKKGGNGYISSYSVNLGSSEVRAVGFLDEDGTPLPLEKFIDAENHEIVIRLKSEEES